MALEYVAALSPSTKASCWSLAESAGHQGWGRMQALLGSYQWDWQQLRGRLAGLAVAWVPDVDGDLIGPGLAIDETAQLKQGDATACVAPQHAGCTGTVENCVTTVFCAYVTAGGQAWVDFDVYLLARWAGDPARRRAVGIPDDLAFATKPESAMRQLQRLIAAGLLVRWVAFDEVYAPQRSTPQASRRGWAGVRGDHPLRLPGHHPGRHHHPRGRRRGQCGVRTPLLRQRVQRTPLQRLGDDRHRYPRPVPADPPAAF